MSRIKVYDPFNTACSLSPPDVPVETPHIIKAYFAQKKLTSNGQESTMFHTVGSGDTLGKLAREHNTTVQRLVDLNHIRNANVIHDGQQLIIPTTVATGNNVSFERITELPLNGEAYIVVETLHFREKTLKINIKQGVQDMLQSVDTTIEVEVDGERKAIIEAEVSRFALDENPLNVDDLLDFAAVKVKFTAADDESNARWVELIRNSEEGYAPVYLLVDAHTGNTDMPQRNFHYYGRNEGTNSLRNGWLDMDGSWFRLTSSRAPWMEVVLTEAREAAGVRETVTPLRQMIEDKYHPHVRLFHADAAAQAWCASFVSWVLSQKGYENPRSAGSRSFQDKNETYFTKVDQPVYGAIATWSDYSKNEAGKYKREYQGHVSFVFGKYSNSETTKRYLFLGGNQGNMLKVTDYDCTGKIFRCYTSRSTGAIVYRKFMGYYIPNTYNVTAADELGPDDTYATETSASLKVTSVALASTEGESTR